MDFLPAHPAVLNFVLCALLAASGYAWGRLTRVGLTGAGLVFTLVLSGALLAALIAVNLNGSSAPVVIGVALHLVASCAALFAPGEDP